MDAVQLPSVAGMEPGNSSCFVGVHPPGARSWREAALAPQPTPVPPGRADARQPVTSPPPAKRFISALLWVQQPRAGVEIRAALCQALNKHIISDSPRPAQSI